MNYLPIRLILLLSLTILMVKVDAANTDSLRQIKRDVGTMSISQIEDHYKLGNKFLDAKEFDKAEREFRIVHEYAKAINDLNQIAFSSNLLGVLYQNKGDYTNALSFFREVESMPESTIEIDSCKTNVKGNIGRIYLILGDYEKAFDYQLEVLQVYESRKDSMKMGNTQYQIGCIFYYQKNYSDALDKYKLVLDLAKNINNQDLEFNALSALGSTYEELNEMDKAIAYNFEALDLVKGTSNTYSIAFAIFNLGTAFLVQKEFGKATSYLEEAESLMLKAGNKWGLIGVYRSLAKLYIEVGVPNKSLKYLRLALPIAEELDSKVRLLEIYDYFGKSYNELGNYKEANAYLNKYIELKQKVLNETTLKEMGNQKTRYEVQKKESEIVLLKKENDILERDQEIGKLYSWIWIGAALFFLLLLGLSFSRYRVQKRSNDLLSDKNKEINKQKEQLEEANKIQVNTNTLLEDKNMQIELQNKQLEDSNEDLKQFAYVASHDLKEPLRMISSYTSILKKRYDPLFDEDAHEFMGYIVDAVGRMETLLSDLLVYSRVSTQENAYKELETRDIVDIVMGNLKFSIQDKGAKVMVNADSLPRIKANSTQMIQLFQNLMSNAIKFTKKSDPQVHVNCVKKEDHYLFTIKDNGIGIKPENKDKIFEMFKRLHTKEEFEGTGIGLATCKKIVVRHGGDIWVESEPGEGSTFHFKIPLLLDASVQAVDQQQKLIQEMSN